jgi:hypothetical protein
VTRERDGVLEPGDPESALAERYGGRWTVGPRLAGARHGITYRDLEIDVHRAELAGGGEVRERPDGMAAGFFDETGRANLPLSSLVGKVMKALGTASTPSAAAPARRSRSRRR